MEHEKNKAGMERVPSRAANPAQGTHLSSLASVITVMKDVESSMASKYSVSSSSSLSSPLGVKKLPRETSKAAASVCDFKKLACFRKSRAQMAAPPLTLLPPLQELPTSVTWSRLSWLSLPLLPFWNVLSFYCSGSEASLLLEAFLDLSTCWSVYLRPSFPFRQTPF